MAFALIVVTGFASPAFTEAREPGPPAASSVVERAHGFLTRPSSAGPRSVTLGYVREHARRFGAGVGAVRELALDDRYTTPDGITHLRWTQRADGIPVLDAGLRANVTSDGRLIDVIGSLSSIGSAAIPAPRLGPRQAVRAGLRQAGAATRAPRVRRVASQGEIVDFRGLDSARLVLYDAGGAPPQPAWRLAVDAGSEGMYDIVVDAIDGEVLRRQSLIDHANPASVLDFYPGAPAGGTQHTVDLAPWLTDPDAVTELRGPVAWVWADLNGDGIRTYGAPPVCAENICPSNGATHPTQWLWPRVALNLDGASCPAAGCSWDPNVGDSWQQNMNQAGVEAFYLVNVFHDHLTADPNIAFDDASGNFGITGGDSDYIRVHVLDGADGPGGLPDETHHNNASMGALPDGSGARMRLYLYTRNGTSASDDASVVFHEYTHGLSNRLIVDAQGMGALHAGVQSRALGEGYSDFYAADYLVERGLQADTPAPGDVRTAPFVGSSRSAGIDCPRGLGKQGCLGDDRSGDGAYTYGDFGQIQADVFESDAHPSGEIWSQTMWDLRTVFGVPAARSLITGGMRLTPPDPTFLDARDGILAQARVIGGEALAAEVLKVFAARGMGVAAATTGADDERPDEDFAAPGVTLALKLHSPLRQRPSAGVGVIARCDHTCKLRATGTLTVRADRGGHRAPRSIHFRLRPARGSVDPDRRRTLRLKLPANAKRALRAGSGRAAVTVRAVDAAGAKSRQSIRIRLR